MILPYNIYLIVTLYGPQTTLQSFVNCIPYNIVLLALYSDPLADFLPITCRNKLIFLNFAKFILSKQVNSSFKINIICYPILSLTILQLYLVSTFIYCITLIITGPVVCHTNIRQFSF